MVRFANIALAALFLPLLVSCTHTATIELVDQYHVVQIPDYTGLPAYFNSELADIWNDSYKDGFQCLVFSSDLDLGEIARKGDMLVISYDLYICGKSTFFYGGPVFPVIRDDDLSFYYAVYWPENLTENDMRYAVTSEYDMPLVLHTQGACLSISAGAMGGAQLRSNQIKVDFP